MLPGKRELARLDHRDQLVDSLMGLGLHLFRISITCAIYFEFFRIENLIREVRLHENIYVQVDVTENAVTYPGRRVYIAVVQSGAAGALEESKDVVPAIEPVVFDRSSPAPDLSEQLVPDIVCESGVEHN